MFHVQPRLSGFQKLSLLLKINKWEVLHMFPREGLGMERAGFPSQALGRSWCVSCNSVAFTRKNTFLSGTLVVRCRRSEYYSYFFFQTRKLKLDEVKGLLRDPRICFDGNRIESLMCSPAHMETVLL